MRIPNKIKISGHLVNVSLENLNNNLSGKAYGGQTDIFNQWIKLQLNMPQEQIESTLIHEIIEQINGLNDLNLNHTQISVLATSIHQVLNDNLDLFSDVDP